MSHGRVITSGFSPPWWLRNPHLQTFWPVLFRRQSSLSHRPERLELPDGDFVDLCWTGPDHGPLVIVLHGLQGSIRSPYAVGILRALAARGIRGVLMHFRGCSGQPNRLARGYHSGETGDLRFLLSTLRQREPETPLAAIGYSLGGNVLLKYLGEAGPETPLRAGVAVSVPLVLRTASDRLGAGLSRIYDRYLLRALLAGAKGYDAIILDVTLPDSDGFTLCKRLRAAGNFTPVIMLTARTQASDRVTGLESGADDYLTKPFDLDELIARVRSMLRRLSWERRAPVVTSSYTFGGAEIDFERHEATMDGKPLKLTSLELDLLRYFVQNAERVISRTELLEKVWKLPNYPNTRTVDNFVMRLRRHFEASPSNPVYFRSVRGAGYKFVPAG